MLALPWLNMELDNGAQGKAASWGGIEGVNVQVTYSGRMKVNVFRYAGNERV